MKVIQVRLNNEIGVLVEEKKEKDHKDKSTGLFCGGGGMMRSESCKK